MMPRAGDDANYGTMIKPSEAVPENKLGRLDCGVEHVGPAADAEQHESINFLSAYTEYTVVEPIMGRQTGPAERIRCAGSYEPAPQIISAGPSRS